MKHKRWYVEEGVPEPITGVVSAVLALFVRSTNDFRDYGGTVKAHKAVVKSGTVQPSEDEKHHYHSAGIDPNRSNAQSAERLGHQLAVEIASCEYILYLE